MIKREYLEPIHTNQKSFYKKAYTVTAEEGSYLDNIVELFSYDTKVAQINKVTRDAQIFGSYSATTLRHIKEFLMQHGFRVGTKKELEIMYLMREF